MTNPNNALGTNAAYGGRTSVNAFNDGLAVFSRGILSGWACVPSSGLTVVLGGDGNTRDVAVAEDNAGNKTTINNISGSPVSVTINAAPTANTRIDYIVAYVDSSPQGTATIVDNYEACGLITVSGAASASPVAPSESAIRSAITADGASGTAAYYVVLASIRLTSGTTTITANEIEAGPAAQIGSNNVPAITPSMIDFTSLGFTTATLNANYTVSTTQSTVLSVTVPTAGIWLVILTGFTQSATTSGYYRPYLYVNNNQVLAQAVEADTGNRKNISQSYAATFNAGDTITLQCVADSGSYIVRAGSRLSIVRVG